MLSGKRRPRRSSTATPPTASPAQYDLGGGATVNGGIFRSYEVGDLANGLGDNATIADFGIAMEF